MSIYKKKNLPILDKLINELVGGDFSSGGGDRNVTSDSEIETGPVQKPFDDTSDYEKGMSTTSDKVFGRYRQNIPWFAVYSFGGTRTGRGLATQIGMTEKNIVTKKTVEEKIDDLVKKSKNSDVTDKNYNPKVSKLIDTIKDCDLSDKQLEDLSNAILDKKNNTKTIKTL